MQGGLKAGLLLDPPAVSLPACRPAGLPAPAPPKSPPALPRLRTGSRRVTDAGLQRLAGLYCRPPAPGLLAQLTSLTINHTAATGGEVGCSLLQSVLLLLAGGAPASLCRRQ